MRCIRIRTQDLEVLSTQDNECRAVYSHPHGKYICKAESRKKKIKRDHFKIFVFCIDTRPKELWRVGV